MAPRLKPKSKQSPPPSSGGSSVSPVRGYSVLKLSTHTDVAARLYFREQEPKAPGREVRRYYLGAIQVGFVRKIDGEPWELFLIDDQSAKSAEKYKTAEAVHDRFRELLQI